MSYPAFVERLFEDSEEKRAEKEEYRLAYDLAVERGFGDWIRNLSDLTAVRRGCYFDHAKAERVRHFIETFLYLAPGKKFKLYEWQYRDVIGPLFGWMRPNGRRRYRTSYTSMAKKNGKSLIASGILLYSLVVEGRPHDGKSGFGIYNASSSRDQAGIIFREVGKIIRNSPLLRERLDVLPSTKRVIDAGTGSFLQTLSSEASSSEGLDALVVVIDELHVFKNDELYNSLLYAGSAQVDPLFIICTTAGARKDENNPCYRQYLYAKQSAADEIDDITYHSAIFEADEKDDILSEETWKRANPSWGGHGGFNREEFLQKAKEAKVSLSALARFNRYRLNMWYSPEDKSYLQEDFWRKCPPLLPIEAYKGLPCYAALDIGGNSDMSALAVVYPHSDKTYTVFPYYWCPEESAWDREASGKAPYKTWIQKGLVRPTPGAATDYDTLKRDILEIAQRHGFTDMAFDPWRGQQLAQELTDEGLKTWECSQAMATMSPPSQKLERLVLRGELRHGSHTVLNWNARNAVVWRDANGNYKVSKEKSGGDGKIDGIIATICALRLADELKGQMPVVIDAGDLLI